MSLMKRTPDELRGISEALLYELQMLFGTAQALREDVQGAKQGMMPWPQKMAFIESFAIHARVLEAFLWDKRRKSYPDDALAIDFFEVGEWEAIRERVQRSALDDLRDRAGHEVAHLSYKRVNKPEEARRWKFDVIASVIGKAFRLFLEYVAPELLCDSFEDRLRATWPGYQLADCDRFSAGLRHRAGDYGRLAEPPGHQPGRSGNIRGNAPAESALTRLTEVGRAGQSAVHQEQFASRRSLGSG